jgi:hypothetical protein
MFFSGETDMLWAEGVIELFRWRRRRRQRAVEAARLVAGAEAYLLAQGAPPQAG